MVKKITRLGQLLRRQLWQSAISNWSYNAVEGMIDEMIEDKITQFTMFSIKLGKFSTQ